MILDTILTVGLFLFVLFWLLMPVIFLIVGSLPTLDSQAHDAVATSAGDMEHAAWTN